MTFAMPFSACFAGAISRNLRRVISMTFFASMAVMALSMPAQACRLALLLALDVSASVDAKEFELQRSGLAAALVAPEVEAAFLSSPDPVALAAFEWSGQWNQRVLLTWRLIGSADDLQRAAADIGTARRGATGFPTSIGYALGFAASMLGDAPVCTRQTIDISGDGKNNHGFSPELAYRNFPLADVTVNALAIGGALEATDLMAYFRREVIKGPNAFVEIANSHRDFERAMRRKLEREVSTLSLTRLAK